MLHGLMNNTRAQNVDTCVGEEVSDGSRWLRANNDERKEGLHHRWRVRVGYSL